MLVLIIESSSEKGCLTLAQKDKMLASTLLLGGPELSKTIAQETHNLLSNQVPGLVAVGIGPGSYTGIRVGVALAKALAYAWQVPCLGFCSLKAFGLPPVLVDARQGGIYALIGEEATLMAPQDLNLPYFRSPHPEIIQKRALQNVPFDTSQPDPSHLAKVVWEQFSREGAPPFDLNYCSTP